LKEPSDAKALITATYTATASAESCDVASPAFAEQEQDGVDESAVAAAAKDEKDERIAVEASVDVVDSSADDVIEKSKDETEVNEEVTDKAKGDAVPTDDDATPAVDSEETEALVTTEGVDAEEGEDDDEAAAEKQRKKDKKKAKKKEKQSKNGSSSSGSESVESDETKEAEATAAAAASDDDAAATVTLTIKLACTNLPKLDYFSKSDPIVALYSDKKDEASGEAGDDGDEAYYYCGQTEVIRDNHDPEWKTTIEYVCRGANTADDHTTLKAVVYDADDDGVIKPKDAIGVCLLSSADLHLPNGGQFDYQLMSATSGEPIEVDGKPSTITVIVTCDGRTVDEPEAAADDVDEEVDRAETLRLLKEAKALKKERKKTRDAKKSRKKEQEAEEVEEGDE
jgi:hypothetical protein